MQKLLTTIDKASIYRNGAEVTRKGTLDLTEGQHTIAVYGLSNSTLLDTVRLFSSEGVVCSNQRFEHISEKNSELESEKIQAQIELINNQIEVKQLQSELWRSNGDFTNRSTQSSSEIQEYIEKLPERLEKLNLDIIELNKEVTKLQKKLEEVQEKENRPIMIVDITVKNGGTFPFEVRYYENSASWAPVYEIHTDSKSPLEILMRAKIHQYSGEDWKDLSVSLFSGNPSASGRLPEIAPVYLNIQEVTNARANATFGMAKAKMAVPMAGAMDMMGEAAAVAADVRMETEEAEVSNDETMTEYILPGHRDIINGSEGTMADLQKYNLDAEYNIVTIPCLDPNAYLIATIKSEDVPFTSSINAAIYLNDIYTGQIFISPDLTKENIEITIGKEERIHVSRREAATKTSKTLFKNQKVVEHSFETKITNNSGSEIKITVKDQIPVSQDKEISVETTDTFGAALEKESGLLTKTISIPSGQTESLTLSYKVSWPKDKKIRETRKIQNRICPVCGSEVFGRFCPECGSVVN